MLLTGILTYLLPEVFTIHFISSPTLRIAGMILLFGGLPIKIASARIPAHAFKNGELVTTGVFSFVQHPFKYLINEEDDYLTGKFGQAYLDYRSCVDGLFPIKRLRRRP